MSEITKIKLPASILELIEDIHGIVDVDFRKVDLSKVHEYASFYGMEVYIADDNNGTLMIAKSKTPVDKLLYYLGLEELSVDTKIRNIYYFEGDLIPNKLEDKVEPGYYNFVAEN